MVLNREREAQIEENLDYCLEIMLSEPSPDRGFEKAKRESKCRTDQILPLLRTAYRIVSLPDIKPRSEMVEKGKKKMVKALKEKK